jgi:hypothetical protein
VVFAALPGSAQLRIFQLLCDSCPPDTPGTCWLAPVCKQWRSLACSVKGLRVLFCSDQQLELDSYLAWSHEYERQVDSFCAWLRRHAPQVVALASSRAQSSDVLEAVAEVAAAAAAAAAAGGDGRTSPAAAAAAGGGGGDGQISAAEASPAAAAAGGGFLPLRHLVINSGGWFEPDVCQDILATLLAALPHLQHLHLLLSSPYYDSYEELGSEAVD